jgi:hypothetical protein
MSALESNVGADCSLLVSPLKVKVGPIDPEVEEVLLEELPEIPPELDARKRLHGTATCLPELEDELVADVLEDVEPELFSDRMPKSTLPDVGLITTSWIVPNVSPDEPCTLQLFSLLAWIS